MVSAVHYLKNPVVICCFFALAVYVNGRGPLSGILGLCFVLSFVWMVHANYRFAKGNSWLLTLAAVAYGACWFIYSIASRTFSLTSGR